MQMSTPDGWNDLHQVPAFVTFGMFIIDEIEFTGSQQPQQNLIGGAGVYAALGARLVAGADRAQSVSWIIDIGSDFPVAFKEDIDRWQTSCVFRTDLSRLTTRAWNGYGPNEHRSFKYLTPKCRLEVASLTDDQARSGSFHMVCSSSRSLDLSTSLRRRRKAIEPDSTEPVIVWEPIPDLCTPEELEKLQLAAREVSVVSPNAEELMGFFPASAITIQDEMVSLLVGWNQSRCLSTYVVIREGAEGSSIYFPPRSSGLDDVETQVTKLHLRAYHTKDMARQVVDPTGGGNTYLGGLAIGMTDVLGGSDLLNLMNNSLPALTSRHDTLKKHSGVIIGALCAVIAASFAIEQCGTPLLSSTAAAAAAAAANDSAQTRAELWNNQTFIGRMEAYLEREHLYILEQVDRLVGQLPT